MFLTIIFPLITGRHSAKFGSLTGVNSLSVRIHIQQKKRLMSSLTQLLTDFRPAWSDLKSYKAYTSSSVIELYENTIALINNNEVRIGFRETHGK